MFVNVRTDTFLLNVPNALDETLYRGQLYANHGGCGFFVPCVTRAEDITAIVRHVPLPLNVMCMPELADFSTLSALGVKRISMGNFIHAATQARLKDLLCQVQMLTTLSRVFLTMKITDSIQCDIWYQALLERAVEFTGVFFVGVKTTGVFCISVCRARKPRRENVEFYNDVKSALDAGFRPCKVCRPTENARTAPAFVEQALRLLREDPKVRLSDSELRQHDISPERVRRWFLQNHGITFQAFQRMQRVNMALQELKAGRSTTDVAFDSGYESLSGFGYTCKN